MNCRIEQWLQLEPHLPGRKGDPGKTGEDNRTFVNAVLWIAKTEAPVARSAGTVRQMEFPFFQRYNRWCKNGVWERVLETLGVRPRLGTPAPRFQHRSLAAHSACGRRERGAHCKALGRSRGGWSTKIHAAVNAHGQPVRFSLTGGQRHDMVEAETLLDNLFPDYVIGDKGYDSDALRIMIRKQGAKPVIPARKGTRRRRYDRTKYKLRNVVERFFNRVKHYRRVATRFEKTDPNYFGFLCLAVRVRPFCESQHDLMLNSRIVGELLQHGSSGVFQLDDISAPQLLLFPGKSVSAQRLRRGIPQTASTLSRRWSPLAA